MTNATRTTLHRLLGLLAIFLSFVVLLAGGRRALAQVDGAAVTIGTWREVESKVLGETRRIIVSTPPGYDRGEERYDVIFLLDGPGHFLHTTGIVHFLAANQKMPPMIVVGIANTDRTRDLTPETDVDSERFPGGGGADKFAECLEQEIIPFVAENYRTSGKRMLIGHSFGGLFAFYALIHHPDLFDSYIAISPSLWWNDQALVAEFTEKVQHANKLEKTIYITTGNEGGPMRSTVHRVIAVLEEKTLEGFRWKTAIMPDETHGTIPHRSTYDGLEFIFAKWQKDQ